MKIPLLFIEGWRWIRNFFTNTVPDFFDGVWEDMKQIGADLINGLWEGIKSVWDWFIDLCTGFIDSVIQGFKDALGIKSPSTVFAEIGKFLIEGLWQGIVDSASWLYDQIAGWVDGVVKDVKGFFGIKSPSTVFAEIGEYLTQGLVKGIQDKASDTLDAVTGWAGDVVDTAKEYFGDTFSLKFAVSPLNDAAKWWSDVKKWWGEKVGAAANFKTGVSNSAKTWWDNTKKWWSEKVGSVSSFKTNVSNSASTWWSNAKKWWGQKVGTVASFKVNVANNASTWWSNVKKWWKQKAGSLSTTLGIKVPSIKVKWDKISAFGKEYKYPTGFVVKAAAAGGIFDAGSLIWAGERGAEVVANAGGGRTGVMNVDQMSDAVFEGVYAAVMAANRASQGDGGQAINIYLDGKQITAAVEKRQRERGASIMGNQVYSY